MNPPRRPGSARPKRERPEGRSPLAAWLFGVVAIGALIFVVLRSGDLHRFELLISRAQPLWLLVALALQGGTYVFVALGWGAVLRRAGARQPLGRLIPIAVTKLFADQVVPSAGMGGNLLLVDRLVAIGTPRGTAVAALLVSMLGFYAAYGLLAIAMLLVLWLHHQTTPLLAGLVGALLMVAVAIPALALWLRRRGRRPLPHWVERIAVVRNLVQAVGEAPAALVADRRLIAQVAGWNALVFIADAATLEACLLALGASPSIGTSFVAVMAASIVVTLGPIPLGLGTFEATSTAMLRLLGVPVVAALAGTLLLRSMTLWLPLIPGLFLMRRAVAHPAHRHKKGAERHSHRPGDTGQVGETVRRSEE